MDLVSKLKAVAFTLSKVEVRGRDNLEGLLGSIQLLDQIIKEESDKPKEPEVTIQEIPAE
jgi:hypothetical protein